MEKLIITAALTGNVPTRDHTPHVPLTPEEIAQDVSRCYDAGASIFHIHARDIQARPTLDLDVFKKTARLIKTRNPEAILQLSTGARAGKDWEARANPVRLASRNGFLYHGIQQPPRALSMKMHPISFGFWPMSSATLASNLKSKCSKPA